MAEEGTSKLPHGKRVTRKQQALDWICRLPDDPENPAELQDKVAETSAVSQKPLVQNESSEPVFVLCKISDRSIVHKLPMINPVNVQATEDGISKDGPRTIAEIPEYKSNRVEGIKNEVWGNTFFTSKRSAKLLGPELAGRFQYKPSNHIVQTSSSSAKPTMRPKSPIHKRKALASKMVHEEDENIHCTIQ